MQDTASTQPSLVKKVPTGTKANISMILGAVLVIFGGIGAGWVLAHKPASSGSDTPSEMAAPGAETKKNEAGIEDESAFPDSAEGMLVEGGIDGEGTHYLDRGLGSTKYVYLTSTVIDLQSFVGKKVTIWGQTISAKKAGWLMDVGKIKVSE